MQQTPQGPRLVMQQRPATPPTPATPNAQATGGGLSGLQLIQTSTGQLVLTGAPIQKPANQTTSLGKNLILGYFPLIILADVFVSLN